MSYEYDPTSVNMMTDLLSGLNDIESGNATSTGAYKSTGDIGVMKDIMSSLNEAGIDYGKPNNMHDYMYEEAPVTSTYSIGSDGLPVDSYVPPAPVVYEYNRPTPKTQRKLIDKNWSLVEEKMTGTKNTMIYSIKCNHSEQIIMNGMMMFEAAQTLVNLLNEGRMLTDAKILGIISSGLQYTVVMNEALKAAKKRQKVLNESRYDEAKELDIIITEKKTEAFKLKERVMNFLKSEGYIK